MASKIATNRLRAELVSMKKDPDPDIIAEPKEDDILTWHYVIKGPADTPYEGGKYIGKLRFPTKYPFKPPSIYMLTPSGRFVVNEKICMSMSDFHPESWNPAWNVGTIIKGIQSFMSSEELTTGGMTASTAARKKFASVSMQFNTKNFPGLFDGDIDGHLAEAKKLHDELLEKKTKMAAAGMELGGGKSNGTGKGKKKGRGKGKSNSSSNNGDTSTNESGSAEQSGTKAEGEAENDDSKVELSAAEIERRRKRNAKKRAKRKAAKSKQEDGDEVKVEGSVVEAEVETEEKKDGNER